MPCTTIDTWYFLVTQIECEVEGKQPPARLSLEDGWKYYESPNDVPHFSY